MQAAHIGVASLCPILVARRVHVQHRELGQQLVALCRLEECVEGCAVVRIWARGEAGEAVSVWARIVPSGRRAAQMSWYVRIFLGLARSPTTVTVTGPQSVSTRWVFLADGLVCLCALRSSYARLSATLLVRSGSIDSCCCATVSVGRGQAPTASRQLAGHGPRLAAALGSAK